MYQEKYAGTFIKEFSKDLGHERLGDATLEEVVELDDGDLLYIPKGKFHRVDTLSPRNINLVSFFGEATPGEALQKKGVVQEAIGYYGKR